MRSGRVKDSAFEEVNNLIDTLCSGEQLNSKYRDHMLHGIYTGYRECHIRGDLLLVYKIERDLMLLILVDIGSHSYLFG